MQVSAVRIRAWLHSETVAPLGLKARRGFLLDDQNPENSEELLKLDITNSSQNTWGITNGAIEGHGSLALFRLRGQARSVLRRRGGANPATRVDLKSRLAVCHASTIFTVRLHCTTSLHDLHCTIRNWPLFWRAMWVKSSIPFCQEPMKTVSMWCRSQLP